jgi:dTDP-4-amino-4,6-dideoxygalactose transaminase
MTSPYTFFATGGAIARLGASPLFCDIDPATYNVSHLAIEDFVQKNCELREGVLVNRHTDGKVKVLMPVHLFGQTAEMDPLLELARKYNLKIVEDAAQAIGAEYVGNRRAGSIGDIGCFSFFPSKNLGAFGDGGMCTTSDPDLAEKMRLLRVHGAKPKYYHSIVGGNFRLDALQAAILLIKFQYLDRWTTARQTNAEYYDRAFQQAKLLGLVSTPVQREGGRHIFNQYVLRVKRRDELKEYLLKEKIGTEIYYPVSLHMQQCFSHLGYRPEDCPEAQRAAQETLAIPIYSELNRHQQDRVIETIISFYQTHA